MNLRNAGHWLLDKIFYISGYLSVAGMVALSIIDISDVKDLKQTFFGVENFEIGKIYYYISVGCSLIFGIISIFNAHETSKLENEGKLKDEKISDLENSLNQVVDETNQLFNSYLKLLVKSLEFSHTERISVYKIYNNEFIRIGRTSEDPTLKNSGRKAYPITEGLIGHGWRTGECFVDNLPDPTLRNGDTYYTAVNSIATIPRNIVNNIKMKSRTYYICRIDGFDSEPKAVFVAESLNDHAFTKENVIEKIEGIKQPLVMFIEKINNAKNNSQHNIENIGL